MTHGEMQSFMRVRLHDLLVDAAAWAIGLVAAVFTRYEFELTTRQLAATAVFLVFARWFINRNPVPKA